ncbi:hypothetical protein EJD97_008131 [Solanum chilense]|uniref:SWIM-type domain-containing protein n=1 Tax=Solanum chilense TaxID=4083 RepID=A0A6N2CE68_SOLCI|nr:hypothetical protein EJD97_008131 [Solanum chilense]
MAKLEKVNHRVKEYLEDDIEIASHTKDTLSRIFEEVLIVNALKFPKLRIFPSSKFIFSIYESGRRYIVCLERKVCTWGIFKVDEIPCAHTIVESKKITNLHSCYSYFYKPDALVKFYEV